MRGRGNDGRREKRQLRGFPRNGFRIPGAEHRLPASRRAALLAIANDAFIGGADVRFDTGIFNFFEGLAGIADEREEAEFHFGGSGGRKLDIPELKVGIEEGDSIGVAAVLRAEMADDADFRFLVEIGQTKDEFLFGRELV